MDSFCESHTLRWTAGQSPSCLCIHLSRGKFFQMYNCFQTNGILRGLWLVSRAQARGHEVTDCWTDKMTDKELRDLFLCFLQSGHSQPNTEISKHKISRYIIWILIYLIINVIIHFINLTIHIHASQGKSVVADIIFKAYIILKKQFT